MKKIISTLTATTMVATTLVSTSACMSTGQTYTYVSDNPNDTTFTNDNLLIGFARPSSNPIY